MNKYDKSLPLITQLTYPQLYFVNEISKSLKKPDILNELNIQSLMYRNKQKYKNILDKKEWINSDPYKPAKYILS